MQSPLDDAEFWELRDLKFHGALEVTYVEMASEQVADTRGAVPDDPKSRTHLISAVTQLLKGTQRLVAVPNGRLVELRFERVYVHRITHESCFSRDSYERVEGTGRLQVLSRSRFMDLFHATAPAPIAAGDPYVHYSVRSVGHILDVISPQLPLIAARGGKPLSGGRR